jgi:hypothetical protein
MHVILIVPHCLSALLLLLLGLQCVVQTVDRATTVELHLGKQQLQSNNTRQLPARTTDAAAAMQTLCCKQARGAARNVLYDYSTEVQHTYGCLTAKRSRVKQLAVVLFTTCQRSFRSE